MKKLKKLPIDAFKNEILECIEKNPVSIIVAETGAGKSTRVPQFLLESTDWQIVVTQPRRVAAKAIAKRVAEEMNCPFGDLVGFRTAIEHRDSSETRCLFVTDGLQLVRELVKTKASISGGICLLIDEVHEWNLNIETLVAWAKRHLLSGTDIKVVLMSATLDFKELSKFFDDAPVIQVPGRCFPVLGSPTHPNGIIQKGSYEMLTEIQRLIAEGANSLVFLPGKGEIKQMERELKQSNPKAEILPLHGDVDSNQQELVFKSFAQPKVVLATNIAQTSLTIPDIDAVVDSGLERRVELINGVETLLLANVSQADCRQRAGRAGRVKEGQYVLCNNKAYDSFSTFPIPEIQRSLLDQMVLRLAGANLNVLELSFYHQPEKQILVDAKKLLYAIEALDLNGEITKLGRKINRFPVNVMFARMMLEALERKCLAPILSIVAILGTRYGSIRRRQRDNDPETYQSWEKLIDSDKEYHSDLLLEYDLFKIARFMKRSELAKKGIDPKGFRTAVEIRERIKTAIHHLGYQNQDHSRNKTNEEEILKCIASGMLVHLYQHAGGNEYVNGETRTLARESIIQNLPSNPEWIVGEPLNIDIVNRRGRAQTIALVKSCTVVDPLWFIKIAPHLVEQKIENLRYDGELMGIVEDHFVLFNGVEIARKKKLADYRLEVLDKFSSALAHHYFPSDSTWQQISDANEANLAKYRKFRIRSGGIIENLDSSFLSNHYQNVLEKAVKDKKIKNLSLPVIEATLGGLSSLYLPLDSYLSAEEENRIKRENPDTVEIAGQEYPVTYGQSSNEFYAQLSVDKKFIQETNLERINLPNGRELVIECENYSGTFSEIRIKFQEQMINNFKAEISQFIVIPQEEPFQRNNWTWQLTEFGQTLQKYFNQIQVEIIENLNSDNQTELIEIVKRKTEEKKKNLLIGYEKANILIKNEEDDLEKTLVEFNMEFAQEEVHQIRNQFIEVKSFLQKAKFTEINNYCREIEKRITELKPMVAKRKKEREDVVKKNNIPNYLLSAFGGDLSRTTQFLANVSKIQTWRLDEHEITCGRSRASQNIKEAWTAMREKSDFFCGADPNDVKYYVHEYHFGNSQNEEDESEIDSSSDAMFEALRRAGLVE